MSSIELVDVTKSFPARKGEHTQVLHGVNIRADDGEFLVLLGPSGCGKTTSLRIMAGLESADGGQVLVDGTSVGDVPAVRRGVAMVFQNYALYPHLSAAENIVFGLRVRRVAAKVRQQKLTDAAEVLGLGPYLDRKPAQMSGGQRQRVALGRALVSDAKVVLMDEPLSNLDAKLRQQMRTELRSLQRRLGLTVVYVTHDQVEAMTMADHVVIMDDGRVEQHATPIDLYTRPASTYVASFIGSPPMNLFPGVVSDGTVVLEGGADAALPLSASVTATGRVTVGVRPESLHVGGAGGAHVGITGRISTVEILGSDTLITVDAGFERPVVMRMTGIATLAEGASIQMRADAEAVNLFDIEDGRRLAPVASQ